VILINNLYVFGTIVNIYFNHNSKAEAEILKLLYGLDDLCSIYKDDSDISKNNSSTDYVEVDPKVYQLLKSSIHYCDLTSGYSDITIKPLIDSINNNQDIKVSLSLVNYKNILLKEPNLVKLKKKGMGIDLGSMVKGYATDLIVDILKQISY
jgi:thiamine biosynthesis lipoprotein